jgi:HSP20 family protein
VLQLFIEQEIAKGRSTRRPCALKTPWYELCWELRVSCARFRAPVGMALFRFGQNWDPFSDLEREVDRLLRSVNLTFQGIRLGRQYPAVNLYELDDEYVLTAELPGTRTEDLELTFAGGILTLKGRRVDSPDVPEHRFRRSERFRGEWQRSVSLPERIREEDVSATFADGVLKVRLPKGVPTPPRQIAVTEGRFDDSSAAEG